MNRKKWIGVLLVLSIFIPAAYGYQEIEVLNIKTPTKVLVQFQATKTVNDTITSIADSRYEVTKTPTSWVFITEDTDHFTISLHIGYGDIPVKQTLIFAVYSGGDLIVQRYIPTDSRNVSFSLDITTGELQRYPTTNEIVSEVMAQVRGELYGLSSSLDRGMRVIDGNEKTFGTVVVAQTIIAAFLALGVVGVFLRNEELRGYIRKKLEKFEPAKKPPVEEKRRKTRRRKMTDVPWWLYLAVASAAALSVLQVLETTYRFSTLEEILKIMKVIGLG